MKDRHEKPATFDAYASNYQGLIRDPIRDKFASGGRFFFDRKIEIIRDFFNRAGIETRELSWLDVGCGQGDLLRSGREYFKTVIGCDPSKGMLESCEELQVRHQPDMEELPFPEASFDFLTAVCVYHHIQVDRRTFMTSEAFRVLRPRGIFCIIEHNPYNPVTRLIVARSPIDADASLLTASASGRLMATSGGRVLARRYFLFFPERMYQVAGSAEKLLGRLPLGGQYAIFSQK